MTDKNKFSMPFIRSPEFAAKKIKTLLTEKEETGIRAGVQGGGCSGFNYHLDFAKEPTNFDHVFESQGIKIETK